MKTKDVLIASTFFVLTIAFIGVCMLSDSFLDWVFARHQNQWSWYIRPILLIPFCFFAFKKSLAGISLTVFAIFTSMMWFNQPPTMSAQVQEFLDFEIRWLQSEWDFNKILLIVSVPFSFFCLAFALWKRSLWMGIAVLVMMATGKIIWSIANAGESGASIIAPAIGGLVVCILFLIIGLRKANKKNQTKR
jgi:hypothetical protein